jgi:histidine triad (HIT) family protein
MSKPCIFCDIVDGQAPATFVQQWTDAVAFVPLDAVTPGHVLVVPKTHVEDFTTSPFTSALTMSRASELAHKMGGPFNLITSKGKEATQSVFHLHIHLVPRVKDDGLTLPWSEGVRKS